MDEGEAQGGRRTAVMPREAGAAGHCAVPWNVVLLDDQEHTYDYVIRMLRELFGCTEERAIRLARAVDREGRAVCLTTHKEHAELKRDQIHAYGKDPLIASCRGSMSAVIEPAEFPGDEEADGTGR